MEYARQTFQDGQVLTAAQMNHIEEGLETLSKSALDKHNQAPDSIIVTDENGDVGATPVEDVIVHVTDKAVEKIRSAEQLPTHLKDESARVVAELKKVVTPDTFVLAAVSDLHATTEDNSPKEISAALDYISTHVKVDALSILGDVGDAAFVKDSLQSVDIPMLIQPGETDTFADVSLLTTLCRKTYRKNAQDRYFYTDYDEHKIRIVSLDTSEFSGDGVCITLEQLKWFGDAIDLSDKEDSKAWRIVILSHFPLDFTEHCNSRMLLNIIDAYQKGNKYEDLYSGIVCDYTKGNNLANIVCNIHGHLHNTLIGYLQLESTSQVLRIGTPNASDGGENHLDLPWKAETTYSKVPNTANSTAFCLYCIDTVTNIIRTICFGAGSSHDNMYDIPEIHTVTSKVFNAVTSDDACELRDGSSYEVSIRVEGGVQPNGSMYDIPVACKLVETPEDLAMNIAHEAVIAVDLDPQGVGIPFAVVASHGPDLTILSGMKFHYDTWVSDNIGGATCCPHVDDTAWGSSIRDYYPYVVDQHGCSIHPVSNMFGIGGVYYDQVRTWVHREYALDTIVGMSINSILIGTYPLLAPGTVKFKNVYITNEKNEIVWKLDIDAMHIEASAESTVFRTLDGEQSINSYYFTSEEMSKNDVLSERLLMSSGTCDSLKYSDVLVGSADNAIESVSLRVGTYHLNNTNSVDEASTLEDKVALIAEDIRSANLDTVCLQAVVGSETEASAVTHHLKNKLPEFPYSYYTPTRNITNNRTSGLMTLSKHPMERVDEYTLPHLSEIEFISTNSAKLSNNYKFRINGIICDSSSKDWSIHLSLENPTEDFYGDAWFGVYPVDVTQDMLYEYGGNAGLSTWKYVWSDKTPAANAELTISSSDTSKPNDGGPVVNTDNIWYNTYPYGPVIGQSFQIVLFYSDGMSGDGYRVADTIQFTLNSTDVNNLNKVIHTQVNVDGAIVNLFNTHIATSVERKDFRTHHAQIKRLGAIARQFSNSIIAGYFNHNQFETTLKYIESGHHTSEYGALSHIDLSFLGTVFTDPEFAENRTNIVYSSETMHMVDGSAVHKHDSVVDPNNFLRYAEFTVDVDPHELRVGSYNIDNLRVNGSNPTEGDNPWMTQVENLAKDIRIHNLDLVALQQVDVNSSRSGNLDIPALLSELTGLPYFKFTETTNLEEHTSGDQTGFTGNAILSRYPIEEVEEIYLPGLPESLGNDTDKRYLTRVKIVKGETSINFINTQLDYLPSNSNEYRDPQMGQIEELTRNLENCIVTGFFYSTYVPPSGEYRTNAAQYLKPLKNALPGRRIADDHVQILYSPQFSHRANRSGTYDYSHTEYSADSSRKLHYVTLKPAEVRCVRVGTCKLSDIYSTNVELKSFQTLADTIRLHSVDILVLYDLDTANNILNTDVAEEIRHIAGFGHISHLVDDYSSSIVLSRYPINYREVIHLSDVEGDANGSLIHAVVNVPNSLINVYSVDLSASEYLTDAVHVATDYIGTATNSIICVCAKNLKDVKLTGFARQFTDVFKQLNQSCSISDADTQTNVWVSRDMLPMHKASKKLDNASGSRLTSVTLLPTQSAEEFLACFEFDSEVSVETTSGFDIVLGSHDVYSVSNVVDPLADGRTVCGVARISTDRLQSLGYDSLEDAIAQGAVVGRVSIAHTPIRLISVREGQEDITSSVYKDRHVHISEVRDDITIVAVN